MYSNNCEAKEHINHRGAREWVRENHINLSSLVRECIDNERGESSNAE